MNQRKDLLSIGTFANLTRLSLKALRIYNQLGILQPRHTDPQSGYRYYEPDQLPPARMIRNLRDMDMPLAEIRRVLAVTDVSQAQAELVIRQYLDQRTRQLEQIQMLARQFIQQLRPEANKMSLEVEVKDGILVIRHKSRMGFSWGSGHGKVTLDVTVPSLRGAELAGSGDINIDKVAGDSFNGAIAGSGNLKLAKVEVGKLKLSIAGSGNASAGSGRAKSAEYEIAGSGGIDAKGVAVETAAVSIAGSGDVAGQASTTASVDIMGSGNVEMTGGAKCTVSKAGSGSARCS